MVATFDLVLRLSYTIPANGDSDAIAKVQAALNAELGEVSTTQASAVPSSTQLIPGSTTYDVTLEGTVALSALTLTDSLTKVSLKSLGQALLKSGTVLATKEHVESA